MQTLSENPALALRRQAQAVGLPGMLRWDRTGRALLLSDAPRHCTGEAFLRAAKALPARVAVEGWLLRLDLPAEAYRALLDCTYVSAGPWTEGWFEAQALLGGVLARTRTAQTVPDEPLLRRAMLACAQGETTVRAFLPALRTADAKALRLGAAASTAACAALCAQWLQTSLGIGLPAQQSAAAWVQIQIAGKSAKG